MYLLIFTKTKRDIFPAKYRIMKTFQFSKLYAYLNFKFGRYLYSLKMCPRIFFYFYSAFEYRYIL